MDASFDATGFGPNAGGWGGDDTANAPPFQASSTNAFERVPLPVRIEDIVNGRVEDDKVQLGNYSFGTLRVCGRVLNVEEKEKETHLVIYDHTATDVDSCDKLAVVVYQNAQGTTQFNEDDIVVALGKLRTFGDSMSLVAFGIYIQPDPAMANIFKLEAQLANRYYVENAPERLSTGPCPPEFEGTLLSTRRIEITNKQNQPSQFGAGFNAGSQSINHLTDTKPNIHGDSAGNRGLTGMREKIYRAISQSTTEQGLSIHEIKSKVGGNNDPNFNDHLQYLINEGIIYNTMDDDHYATI